MIAAVVVFWASLGALAWTHVLYPAVAAVGARLRTKPVAVDDGYLPTVAVIVVAYNEERDIERRIANLRELDYPQELLEIVVTSDASTDRTEELAAAAGARVIRNQRGGKVAAQDAAVRGTEAEVVAFSDANATWSPDALRKLVRNLADPKVAYVCGRLQLEAVDGGNQEGVYWRYELGLRSLESRLCSITAGNGAIYATRREDYLVVDPIMGHDLSLPFNMVKRGRRAVYVPQARAREKMVPTLGGEYARKRRMMSHTWPIVLRGGMLSPRGYPPAYALMIFSHRVLRYCTPLLHVLALAANVALLAAGAGTLYWVTLALQLALALAALLGGALRMRPLLLARYYVLTTASLAAGLWDWVRHGTAAWWDAAEGTR